jgi:hypothetical protein
MESVRSRVGTRGPFAVAALAATAVPYAEGAFKLVWIELGLLVVILWGLLAPGTDEGPKGVLVAVMTFCIAVTLGDLALRAAVGSRLHHMPTDTYARRLPSLPILGRWDANVSFVGSGYGDLAMMVRDPAVRQVRTVAFRTDDAGFRNEASAGPMDLVILGDSFGAGVGTTQDEIFARVLETRYGLRTYNLAFQGIGPWREYLNWAIESPRLAIAAHGTVLWVLYSGNDLGDEYGQVGNLAALPWTDTLRAWHTRYRTFWGRSVLRNWTESIPRLGRKGDTGVPERALPDGGRMLFYGPAERSARLSLVEVERHPNFPKLERTMAEMKRLVALQGLELAVIILPTKGEVYPWIYETREVTPEDLDSSGFSQAVMGLCVRLELGCWDTKPYLVETARRLLADSGEYLWWLDDSHLNSRGHAALATFVHKQVLRNKDN